MRIDKFLSEMGVATRSEASRAAKNGEISVDGVVCKKADAHIDPSVQRITYKGEEIHYAKNVYVMLNKPDGYVSATEDREEKTVLELLPEELQKRELFPCGRLDKHTLGLMLLTDNGDLAHRLLSPKKHVAKKYRYTSKFPITNEEKEKLEYGLTLDGGYETKPAQIELFDDKKSGYITLTEGKYHQIKRMFEAVNNKITALERVTFGPLILDEKLARGEWRYLTNEEISALEAHK